MLGILVRKLLRDIWIPLVVVAVLLCAFEMLWAYVTRRITTDLLPQVTGYILKQQSTTPLWLLTGGGDREQAEKVAKDLQEMIFEGPGKIIQALVGGQQMRQGQQLDLSQPLNTMSIGYVHPLILTILCIWAIGRAAGAIAGEIDRGTMELLLAQPVPRWRVIAAHGYVDLITIPLLCLSLWAGSWIGTALVGMLSLSNGQAGVNPMAFLPALFFAAGLLFAVSGYTMWLSSMGRLRGRVMGIAVLVTLLQFLINLIGQLWEVLEPIRPFTIFYYYQPQPMILSQDWRAEPELWAHLGMLFAVGMVGYILALVTFSRRNLPAPL